MSEPVILPKVPSQLIQIALEDLEKCERAEEFEIDMSSWFDRRDGVCEVCAAGAVMAQRLPSDGALLYPGDFPENEDQLFAINWLRTGDVSGACCELGIVQPPEVAGIYPITRYHRDAKQFKSDLRSLAKTLKAAGI